MSGWPWSELGLPGPAELPEIRHAYAGRLETTHPEDDPEGFQKLHSAYTLACRIARQNRRHSERPVPPDRPPQDAPGPAPAEADGSSRPAHGWNEDLIRALEASAATRRPEAGQDDETAESYDQPLHQLAWDPNAAPPPERPGDRDWDWDALLKKDEAPPPPQKEKREKDSDWDFHALLRAKEDAPPPEEDRAARGQGEDWDYDTLLAEGERERRAAARRSGPRNGNGGQRRAEDAWARTDAALRAMEQLCASNAPLPAWTAFLQGPLFSSLTGELDLIFGLEELLQRHPELSRPVRRAIAAACGLTRRPAQPELQTLYRMLRAVPRGNTQPRKIQIRKPYAIAAAVLWLLVFSYLIPWDTVGTPSATGEQQRAQTCAYLEEDFGQPFHSLAGGEAEYDNLFAPDDDPYLLFLAGPDGPRDKEAGKRGYETNYTEALVKREIEDFANAHGLDLRLDSAGGYRGTRGETPGAYIIDLPLTGAGEEITALGGLLTQLEEADWYQELTPEFQVFLCYRGLAFYDAVSTGEPFDADLARSIYEEDIGPMFCRYLINDLGLSARHFGEGVPLALKGEGETEIDGSLFFWVKWENGGGKAVYYFLHSAGAQLFCLPAEQVEGKELTALSLYQGHTEVLEAESVDLRVLVIDHVDPA